MPDTQIFIRNDDVGALTPALTRFFDVFGERGLPVSHQIIPTRLTSECAAFLLEAQARDPQAIDFGQHGLCHEMLVRGRVEYYEFGPERSYEQQRADIHEGRRLLADLLGNAEVRVFTPPRHRYDRNTLRALDEEGFKVFSASSYPGLKHRLAYGAGRMLGLTNLGRPGVPYHGRRRADCGLFELSIAVAADNAATLAGSVDDLVAAVERARGGTNILGIMFHHEAYAAPDRADHLRRLADRLAALPGVSFSTIGALHRRLAPAG